MTDSAINTVFDQILAVLRQDWLLAFTPHGVDVSLSEWHPQPANVDPARTPFAWIVQRPDDMALSEDANNGYMFWTIGFDAKALYLQRDATAGKTPQQWANEMAEALYSSLIGHHALDVYALVEVTTNGNPRMQIGEKGCEVVVPLKITFPYGG